MSKATELLNSISEAKDGLEYDPISNPKRAKIVAKMNDTFRKTWGLMPPGKIVQTRGISLLPDETQSKIREEIEKFKKFNSANDPYKEHDFGKIVVDGHKVYWKIEYYDKSYRYGSPDPSDPGKTKRVMTIMLASEY